MLVRRRAVFVTGTRKLVHTDFCPVAESGSVRQMQNVVFALQLAIPMGHMCIKRRDTTGTWATGVLLQERIPDSVVT